MIEFLFWYVPLCYLVNFVLLVWIWAALDEKDKEEDSRFLIGCLFIMAPFSAPIIVFLVIIVVASHFIAMAGDKLRKRW